MGVLAHEAPLIFLLTYPSLDFFCRHSLFSFSSPLSPPPRASPSHRRAALSPSLRRPSRLPLADALSPLAPSRLLLPLLLSPPRRSLTAPTPARRRDPAPSWRIAPAAIEPRRGGARCGAMSAEEAEAQAGLSPGVGIS